MVNPSYKQEVEYYVIATLIQHPEVIKQYNLKEEHFYHYNNLLAYKTIVGMTKVGEEINLVSFGSRFYDVGGKISEITALFNTEDWYSPLMMGTYLKQLAEELVKRRILEKYNDLKDVPKEFIEEVKKCELEFVEKKASSLGELMGVYEERYKEKKQRTQDRGSVGLVTGFTKIDQNCVLQGGNLAILAAKTSVGKTALALNMGINAAMFEQNVLFFSAEMTSQELMDRVFAQLTGVSSTKFKYANADEAMVVAKREIEHCKDNLRLIDHASLTSVDVSTISRQQEKKPDLIIVDYIQYLKDPIGKGTNNDRIGEITRNLKSLALELDCVVLALSQVNRATTGAPELHNLRDSGNLEQDADAVFILHREDREDVIAEFNVAKNRNGQLGKFQLRFKPELTKYYE